MKKGKLTYLWRTRSATILTCILLVVGIAVLGIMMAASGDAEITTSLTLAGFIGAIALLYKILGDAQEINTSFRKRKVMIIQAPDALGFELKLNSALSKLADDGYEIMELRDKDDFMTYIYYFAKNDE